ncbi:hypothetical protein H6F43_01390, partial [Leptolyngbya sp. FACHB-36]|nr:hypothetical protein [Leptolyngbya sp. FACHB-36]
MNRIQRSSPLTRRQFTLLSASSFGWLMASSTGVAMAFPRLNQRQNFALKRPPI